MADNAEIILRFYAAFKKNDYKAMQACYHPEAKFSDPVFPNLNSKEVKAMWQMLLTAAKDLKVEHSGFLPTAGGGGTARLDAWYTFSRTGRKVHNIIFTSFEVKDGLIYRHNDKFDFWRWSRQALGLSGVLLGWTPMVKNKVRSTARKGLDKFLKEAVNL